MINGSPIPVLAHRNPDLPRLGGTISRCSSEPRAKSVDQPALGEMFHQATDEGFRGLGCTESAQERL